MNNKFYLLMSMLCLFMITTVQAQLSSLPTGSSSLSTDIDGTPYLDENFVAGVIYQDKNPFKVALRYNANKDVMEYMQGQLNMYVEAGPKVPKVTIGSTVYVARIYENKHQKKFGFFTVLDSGHVTLYCRKVISFHSMKKGQAPDFKDQPAGYERESDEYYYQVGNGQLQELGSIKSMIASLPDRQEELTTFAKKEKISAGKEQKVVKFVRYYNSLAAVDAQGE